MCRQQIIWIVNSNIKFTAIQSISYGNLESIGNDMVINLLLKVLLWFMIFDYDYDSIVIMIFSFQMLAGSMDQKGGSANIGGAAWTSEEDGRGRVW